MSEALIQKEFIRRQHISSALMAFISLHFEYSSKGKLKRGAVQKEISDFFGIKLSTPFCQIINRCMQEKGYTLRIIRGYQYYKNIRRI